jgi:hypothetical protein
MKTLNDTDKAFGIMQLLCFIFWILVKIPVLHQFVLFGVLYEAGWILTAILCIICSSYFFYKWIRAQFSLSTVYFYGFTLGIITLLIMRFVE